MIPQFPIHPVVSLVAVEEYQKGLVSWSRTFSKNRKNHLLDIFGFGILFTWTSFLMDWPMLRAVAMFWDCSSNIFNFSYNELVSTFDEFCTFTDMPRDGPLALPNQGHSTDRALAELLNLTPAECAVMVHGSWVHLTSLPRRFKNHQQFDDRSYLARRENAFALCLFAQHLFVDHDGMVDAQVVVIVLEARKCKFNLISVILGENIHGIRQLAKGGVYMQKGSPLLLMVWLCEHFRVISAPSTSDTTWTYSRRRLEYRFSTIEAWEEFFVSRDTCDIPWTIPHCKITEFLLRTAGYINVLLPSLRHTTYYLPYRVCR